MKNRLRRYVKDIVYGANDGIITTFAVIAGVAGAHLSNATILIVGFASLLADGFSMASSNYLGSRSECATENENGEDCGPEATIYGPVWTFGSFVIAGAVPLLPYLFMNGGERIFLYSIIATAIALILVGIFRASITHQSYAHSIMEMLVVGGVAALIAYYVGSLLERLVL